LTRLCRCACGCQRELAENENPRLTRCTPCRTKASLDCAQTKRREGFSPEWVEETLNRLQAERKAKRKAASWQSGN
jgi:hypothetical protein